MRTIVLQSIKCRLNDETDKDEIYIKYRGEKIWPETSYVSIDNEQKLAIKFSFEHPDDIMELELWDHDYLSANDLLGTFIMDVTEPGGPYQTDMMRADAKSMASYTLHWEVV